MRVCMLLLVVLAAATIAAGHAGDNLPSQNNTNLTSAVDESTDLTSAIEWVPDNLHLDAEEEAVGPVEALGGGYGGYGYYDYYDYPYYRPSKVVVVKPYYPRR